MKLDITKPELVWPGKYDEDGNLVENRGAALPFQVIETIKEGRATRQSGYAADLFSYTAQQSDEDNWHNKLIWGDNLLVMASLLRDLAGEIDLIYIDPPFATGADFSFQTTVGEEEYKVKKEQSLIEEVAYRDTWGGGAPTFLRMLSDRLRLMRDLLSARGSIFVHCDWHVGHCIKLLLDDIFGSAHLINEIVWCYTGPGSPGMRQFSRKHDTIFWYSKSDQRIFNAEDVRIPHHAKTRDNFKRGLEGSGFVADTYELAEKGKIPEDWWEMAIASRYPVDGVKRTGYATEKPWPLIERIVKAASEEGSLVADFFCGSGTTMAVAEKLGRRWIGCDLGRWAVHMARKRLLGVEDVNPFEILNLGKYERKYWQGAEFGSGGADEQAQAAYIAYIRFILDLYQAQPIQGEHVHGKKGSALVMVGAVDAPVTISHINDGLAECAAMDREELHVLGWEWEMGMNDPIVKQAKTDGVRLRLLSIPREVMEKRAVECGDIRFFDLAYLEAEVKSVGKKTDEIRVELTDFVIPDTELIPEDVRSKVTKWSDYIDYWAVDWDFQHDTFMNQWQTYRTRQNRKLELVSEKHKYEAPGTYKVLIKVVDIFGNDTSRMLEWEVK